MTSTYEVSSHVHTMYIKSQQFKYLAFDQKFRMCPNICFYMENGNTSLSTGIGGGGKERASEQHSQKKMFWQHVLEVIVKLFIITVHFPSHLCASSSNGSACFLALIIPWLCSALAFHSHFLSHPVEMRGEQ